MAEFEGWKVEVSGIDAKEVENVMLAVMDNMPKIPVTENRYLSFDDQVGIPTDLYNRLQKTLLLCGPFANDSALSAIFVDSRISPWRHKLPQVNTPYERVRVVINFLYNQRNNSQENALVLLLQILSDQTNPSDSCHKNLAELADEVKKLCI